jgi:hypothetical protein
MTAMNELETAKNLLADGNKERAIQLLATILLADQTDIQAWLLMADSIEDPNKKKDCYHQVLRLSPKHALAMESLRKLVFSQDMVGINSPEPLQGTVSNDPSVPKGEPVPTFRNIRNALKMTLTVFVGLAVLSGLGYSAWVILAGNSSSDVTPVCMEVFFVGVLAALLALFTSSKK